MSTRRVAATSRAEEGHGDAARRLTGAFEAVGDVGFALLDARGILVAASATWRTRHAEALGRRLRLGHRLVDSLERPAGPPPAWLASYAAHLRAADGSWLELQWSAASRLRARFVRTGGGELLAQIEDVTERHGDMEALRESAERFRSFAETSGDWFWEIDGRLRYRLRTASTRHGHGEEDTLTGQGFLDRLRRLAVDPSEVEPIARSIAAREPFRECEVRLRDDDGEERVSSLSGVPLVGADGTLHGYRGTGRNVTESHALARRLTHQATHDDLTGLANRRALEARIQQVMRAADAQRARYALLFLDVDQIKVVNDTCGHGAGDALLNRLARRLRQGLRGADTVARLGGDEFAVLLRDCDAREAHRLAEKVRRGASGRPFVWEGQQFRITVSIGVAPLSPDMNDPGDLLRAADSACYAAKERGRNRVKLYALDDSTLNLRQGEMHWVARIHSALAENRFELCLQPIAPAAPASRSPDAPGGTGDAAGHRHFEALLRMKGRDGRIHAPGAFMPAAERYNIARQLDAWVLDEALAWLERSPLFLDRLQVLSVNLSGQSLGEPGFLDHVAGRMRRHPRSAPKLCFEITETAAISNLEQAQQFIRAMRTFGCRFALDDFGSGLSSFAYLRTLDVDYLKIDGMFIKDVHDDPIHHAMVRSINEVGHVMGKKTIAEFVENDVVRATLAAIGVDYVQGYGIGKPVLFADVV